MSNFKPEDFDKLARFAGGKELPAIITSEPSGVWQFPDGQVVEQYKWRPDINPAHADLVLRALVQVLPKDGIRIEFAIGELLGTVCSVVTIKSWETSAWWPEAVCRAALKFIEKGENDGC